MDPYLVTLQRVHIVGFDKAWSVEHMQELTL